MSVGIDIRNRVATLAFSRPEKKNAITAAMYQQAADGLKEADAHDDVRVIVITGDGGCFTAGNDLEDFLQRPPQGDDSPVAQFMNALRTAPKPVVAAVPGLAIGIGTTLLLHCDLVYAAQGARFAMPFTQLGLCPEFASSVLLPRIAGHQWAAEKLLLGEPFDAAEAEKMGLVNRVLPAEELMPFVQAQAAKLAALPSESLRVTKQLLKADLQTQVAAAMLTEMQHFTRLLSGPDAKEAFTAFREKRKPVFR
ncbi:MAG: enoyl-CoA hydratase [Burkholderiaceae bacterium]|nr:enoyl-CoA hydratase [Burkholderiaceae bacterium]